MQPNTNARRKSRPTIGVSCDVTDVDVPRLNVQLTYIDYVAGSGGLPVVLPPEPSALDLLDDVDGVLFIGGDDYRCGNRGAPPAQFDPVHPRREKSDIALAAAVLERDLPLFAICGGFQLLTLVAGGTIYGDLPSEAPPSDICHRREAPTGPLVEHPLRWSGHSGLSALPAGEYQINSHHHQAACDVAPEWKVIGEAPDGTIEAAVGPGRWQLGVQWHPERDPSNPVNATLISEFLAAAAAPTDEQQAVPGARR